MNAQTFDRGQALHHFLVARGSHDRAGRHCGDQCPPPGRHDRRLPDLALGHPERRAHERPDLCGRDGVARHLHVARTFRPPSATATCCSNSTSASSRWSRSGARRCAPDDAAQFEEFSKRVAQFIEFRKELVRLGVEVSPAKGREWGDNEANRSVRTALNQDLDKLAAIYDARTKRIYAALEERLTLDHLAAQRAGALGARARGGRRPCHLARRDAPARRHHARDRSRLRAASRHGGPAYGAARRSRRARALDRGVPAGDAAATPNSTAPSPTRRRRARRATRISSRRSNRSVCRSSRRCRRVGRNAEVMRTTAQSLTGVAAHAADQTGSASIASDDTASNVKRLRRHPKN